MKYYFFFILLIYVSVSHQNVFGQSTSPVTYNTSGTFTWAVPAGVTQITVEAWGGGGGGSANKGDGGGGGAYAKSTIVVSPGSYPITVGSGGTGGSTGGNGGNSIFGSSLVVAAGAQGNTGGNAANCVGDVKWSGGNGGVSAGNSGGGGGGSAFIDANGNPGIGGTGGTGTGNGGDGGSGNNVPGVHGFNPGGGGGAGGNKTTAGANGAAGKIIISWCLSPVLTTHPVNQTVTYGNNASFSVLTSATNVSTYQWQKNSGSGWVNTGTNNATLTITNPSVLMNGSQYRCIVTVDCGAFTISNTATLTVIKKALSITATNQEKCFGDLFVFSGNEFSSAGLVGVETIGNVSFTCTGTGINAATGNYAITPSAAAGGTFNPDNYQISYIDGQLVVKPLPTLTGASQDAIVCEGVIAIINLSGLLPEKTFSLDFSINGVAQTQKTGLYSDASGISSFTTPVLSAGNDGQTLQITGITITSETPNCSQSFNQNITLQVNPIPVFNLTGSTLEVCLGDVLTTLTFSVTAGSPDKYSIDFDNVAEAQGFTDITNASLSGSTIDITVPATAAPDVYNAVFKGTNSTTGCISADNTFTIIVHSIPKIGGIN